MPDTAAKGCIAVAAAFSLRDSRPEDRSQTLPLAPASPGKAAYRLRTLLLVTQRLNRIFLRRLGGRIDSKEDPYHGGEAHRQHHHSRLDNGLHA